MSSVMPDAVLRMPPELWGDNLPDINQRHQRYIQAADRIQKLEGILKEILDSQKMGYIDWDAMRQAKKSLDSD